MDQPREGEREAGDCPAGAGRRPGKDREAEEAGRESTGDDEFSEAARFAYIQLGLLPNQFLDLTPNELRALQEHHRLEVNRERELSAFAGYCSGAAFAMAWAGELTEFKDFYRIDEPVVNTSSELDLEYHIRMMRLCGEGGPPLDH